ncbi:hypothetical protein NFI96_026498 [Prochilodus magdalenae]|nr:hypothetical protein NFI96_026498 [Prochilodus magdalenae]
MEKFQVVGPDGPVVATAGSDVVLPCSIRTQSDQTSKSAVDMNIKWTRSDPGGGVVHSYLHGKDSDVGQSPQFRGRTALFNEELRNGNTSLRLSKVTTSDEGQYKCRAESDLGNSEVSFDLLVEVIGSRPVITVERYDKKSGVFSVLCESEGWWPEPGLQWLDGSGLSLTEGETHRDAELFRVESHLPVHLHHVTTFTCRVTGRERMMEETITASAFYVSGGRPVITVDSYSAYSGEFTLLCESEGWWPEPEVQWVDCDGDALPGGATELLRAAELFRVKRRVTLQYNDITTIFCRVRVRDHTVEERIKSRTIHDQVPHPAAHRTGWVAGSVVGMILVLILVANFCIYKLMRRMKGEMEELKRVMSVMSEEEHDHSAAGTGLLQSGDKQPGAWAQFKEIRSVPILRKKLSKKAESHGTLLLCDCGLTERSCAVLASALKSEYSRLTELILRWNLLRDSGVKKLCEGLKSTKCKLEKLELSGCSIGDKGCADLSKALRSNPSSHLTELSLNGNTLGDSGVKELSDLLKSPNCKLEKLELVYCSITGEGCAAMFKALRSNPSSLRELNLNGNNPGESGVNELSDLLKDPDCTLEKLHLESCSITDGGCAALFTALQSNPSSHLRELNLSNSNPRDSGLEKLSDLLKDANCKLRKLELQHCTITDKGCADLIEALKSNPSPGVKTLRLNLNNNQAGELTRAVCKSPENST